MNELYAELLDVISTKDKKKGYRALSALFHRFINTATADVRAGMEMTGPFAKTDYLLKENDASPTLRHAVNGARTRFKKLSEIPVENCSVLFHQDYEALARFIALVEKTEIPPEVASHFPSTPKEEKPVRKRLTGDYMRFRVDRFDNRFLYATSEEDGTRQYRIDYVSPSQAYPYPNDYLGEIMFDGAQINVIRPLVEDDTLYPELIILEPDLLIDVSAVAGCFETYANDARIALLKRISPAAVGDAINLGNFAGQLLDEEIHSGSTPRPYNESATLFFRNNALAVSAAPPKAGFHEDVRLQQKNIRQALHTDLPAQFSGFSLDKVMTEPSFFSEMLGLQGRMDFLQLDMRVLAEQKSGKGEWPYNDFKIPRGRTPHYIQLLLYMLIIRYNYRVRYEANRRRLDPFLMYSKYERSLLALGFAPALVHQAIKIRNQIASSDIRYAEEGMEFLASLTPEMLNQNPPSRLWQQFTLPSLTALLEPIRDVEATDRGYYLRLMRFVAKEHLLSKTGSRRKENSGFASLWQTPLEEKIESGNIYVGLKITEYLPCTEKIEQLRLTFPDGENSTLANFRKGDVVILYSYPEGGMPDARRNMVFRSTVAEISSDSLLLCLRSPQSSTLPFTNRAIVSSEHIVWAVEHDYMESSFTALYRALHSFLSAPTSRRDLLMLRRRPEIEPGLSLSCDHGSFNTLALRARQARDLFLIVGPPGTGKTSFGLMTSLREELAEADSQILILAFTNRAVDEICCKLADDGIDYIRFGSELSCSSPLENLFSNRITGCRNANEVRELIARTRVCVATTTALNSSPYLFMIKSFSLAIIDEASQILEPHIIGILSAKTPEGTPAIGRFIMIGDHKQLPAVVMQRSEDSAVEEDALRQIGLTDCSLSLFERMMRVYGEDPEVCYMLSRQGRMHQEIAAFPNEAFYGGRLSVVPLPHQTVALPPPAKRSEERGLRDILTTERMAFFDVEPHERGVSDKVNLSEARLIAQMVKEIYDLRHDSFDPDRTVGVIVPYRNQISAIRQEISTFGIEALAAITIDTIERYQGSQRKFIIYGFTISRRYQLGFLTDQTFQEEGSIIDRKLNVAMTRAEEHLLLVGNAPLLKTNDMFDRLISYIDNQGGYYSFSHPRK